MVMKEGCAHSASTNPLPTKLAGRIEALHPDRGDIHGTVRCEATRVSVEAENSASYAFSKLEKHVQYCMH